MANRIRDIFEPSATIRRMRLKLLRDLHRCHIGQCCTCVHYEHPPIGTPGWYEDYGSCRKHVLVFDLKMTSISQIPCVSYKEDLEKLQRIEDELKKLEEEK